MWVYIPGQRRRAESDEASGPVENGVSHSSSAAGQSQIKSSSNTPVMQGTKRARKLFLRFFVGQRQQLVQFLLSFFAIALISTSTASTLLVHRNHPTSDIIEVQDQQLTRHQQRATQINF
jgi:hypothetical protein